MQKIGSTAAKFVSLSILLVCLIFAAPHAHSQQLEYNDSEKVGFAFYQFINSEPDFDSWVENTDAYIEAKPVEKQKMMQRETVRLRNAFYHYIPDQDLVKFTVKAKVEVSNYYHRSQMEGIKTNVNITLQGIPENYFPFQVGDMWIAVVAQDVEKLLHQTMNANEYNVFAQKIGFDKRIYALQDVLNIEFRLRPISADSEAPIMLADIPMWLMLAEIGSMEAWIDIGGNQRQYVLEHHADWYYPQEQNEILDLYGR